MEIRDPRASPENADDLRQYHRAASGILRSLSAMLSEAHEQPLSELRAYASVKGIWAHRFSSVNAPLSGIERFPRPVADAELIAASSGVVELFEIFAPSAHRLVLDVWENIWSEIVHSILTSSTRRQIEKSVILAPGLDYFDRLIPAVLNENGTPAWKVLRQIPEISPREQSSLQSHLEREFHVARDRRIERGHVNHNGETRVTPSPVRVVPAREDAKLPPADGDRTRYSDPENYERNKWLCENWIDGKTMSRLIDELGKQANWNIIESPQGVMAAITTYAEFEDIVIPRKRPGRRKKGQGR